MARHGKTMLNPQWLNTFKTLVEVGHFTQTAERLFMTQPGVSQHIKKLEQACNNDLIVRFGKRFELTEQGQLVYAYAVEQAKCEQQLLEKMQGDNEFAGCCRLAMSGALALRLFPKILELQQLHPQLSIQLEAAPNHKILDDLQRNDIDIGIVTQQVSSMDCVLTELTDEPLYLILPKRYATQELTIETLIDCGLVAHPDAQHYVSLFLEECGNLQLTQCVFADLPVRSYINQLSQILLPVASGLGFTVLPKSAYEAFEDKDSLYVYQTPKMVKETLFWVQKRHRELPRRYKMLMKVVEDELQ